jgi:hypothetical protein
LEYFCHDVSSPHRGTRRRCQLITVVPDLEAVIVISSRASDTPPDIEDHLAMMDAAIVPELS